MDEVRSSSDRLRAQTRRHLFEQCGIGVGAMALASLLGAESARAADSGSGGSPSKLHHPARARRVIYLHMAGGPSQIDLFDPKPKLRELHGQAPPASAVEGKRFAFLKPGATLLGSPRQFTRHGKSGAVLSDLLPHLGKVADELCFIRGMKTDVFNHGPAKLFMQTGSVQMGRPAMGSWLTYGLGSEASDLPGFVVLQSGPRGPRGGHVLWGSGFLPTSFQGVPLLPGPQPILNLKNPAGIDDSRQRQFIDLVEQLNRRRQALTGDPEIATRIAAYEVAYRMQTSAPALMDLSGESQQTLDLYGAAPGKASFANNCLLARRLVERGVRFVQLWHTDWDHHGGPGADLESSLPQICREIDQPCAALVLDLKQRGLLDDTIVLWGGEFGRTPLGEPRETTGRDHHIDAFTMWAAGGGFRAGAVTGETDDLGWSVTADPVHVHDLHATLLHLMGIDHLRLTYRFQGRDFRLTDVHGEVKRNLLA